MKTKHFIIAFFTLVLAVINANANNMLVQNVTTLNDNPTAKTVQVQFDLSWENSWRDSINWDAAWIFLKFKDANGLWQHAKLNTNGFQNGSGTSNTVQVTSDNVGAWVYRNSRGSGTFNSTTMQLQWNYGLSGLSKVTGLEVRVFAVEMVYVPEGEFNAAKSFYSQGTSRVFIAPGNNFPVINSILSPPLTYNDGTSVTFRIKGDAGIDTNNDGTVDNTSYPTGYRSFYCYKYELTEQQYADFLNTLTSSQITTIGVAGSGITLTNGQYFSSTPNKACNNAIKLDSNFQSSLRFLAYADWSGVRPMSFLEFNKASYGPIQPVYLEVLSSVSSGNYSIIRGYPSWGASNTGPNNFASTATNVGYAAVANSTRISAGASYYGILDLTGNATEPTVKLNFNSFTTTNGNGILTSNGTTDNNLWKNTGMIIFIEQSSSNKTTSNFGFRYVRSAE